jgi:hypothetical protein
MITKEDLIGVTKIPQKISPEAFAALEKREVPKGFEWDRAISLCLCRRCGMYGETPKGYVEDLIKTMITLKQSPEAMLGEDPEIVLAKNPKTFRKFYFIIDHCSVCQQPGEQNIKIEMKPRF